VSRHPRGTGAGRARARISPTGPHGASATSASRALWTCLPLNRILSCSRVRAAESIGWPFGDELFLARIERSTNRSLKPCKPGQKPQVLN
jgi:hypothetical protein